MFKATAENRAEICEAKFQQAVHMFAKDTFLQLTNFQIYSELIELVEPMRTKDYSKFLFDKVENLHEQTIEAASNEAAKAAKAKLIEVAKKISSRKS